MKELLIQEIISKCKNLLQLLELVEQDTTLNAHQEQLKKHLKNVLNAKNES